MNEQHWKVEKQPAWLVAAIRKTIAALPGGYIEAAEILDTTQDAIFNRLRAGGDQIFPMGWAMVCKPQALATSPMFFRAKPTTGSMFLVRLMKTRTRRLV